jgi:hypothetical protein
MTSKVVKAKKTKKATAKRPGKTTKK